MKYIGLMVVSAVFGCGRSAIGDAADSPNAPSFGSPELLSAYAEDGLACRALSAKPDNGRLLVTGGCSSSATDSDWRVWSYDPATDTWARLDLFRSAVGAQMFATAVTRTSAGDIFVGGYGIEGSNSRRYVRASRDQGVTWAVVDNPVAQNGTLSGIASAGGAVLTIATTLSSNGGWVVRRSNDRGSTWYDVDIRGFSTQGHALAVLADGVYALGLSHTDQPTITSWTVRMSGDNGASWNQVSDFFTAATGSQLQQAFTMPNDNRLFVAGSWTTEERWRVVSTSDRKSWKVNEDFTAALGLADLGGGVLNHSSGRTIVSGGERAAEDDSGGVGLVRSTADAKRWTTLAETSADATGSTIGPFVGSTEDVDASLILIGTYGPAGAGSLAATRIPYGVD